MYFVFQKLLLLVFLIVAVPFRGALNFHFAV